MRFDFPRKPPAINLKSGKLHYTLRKKENIEIYSYIFEIIQIKRADRHLILTSPYELKI